MNNKGFILVTGLLLVLVLTVLGVMATLMVTKDIRSAAIDRSIKQVFYIAEAGTEEARARFQNSSANKITDTLPNDPDWRAFIGDGTKFDYNSSNPKHFLFSNLTGLNYAVKIQHKVNSSNQVLYWTGSVETTSINQNIYVITSVGFDSQGSFKRIQIEVVPPMAIPIPGAVYARENVKVKGNSSGIRGEDDCGLGGVPGITTIYAPGVNVNLTGSKNVTGLPQFGNPVDLDIISLANSLKNNAQIFHDLNTAISYGDPTKPNDKVACPDQIIYVNGNMNKTGGQGCGILVVNGDWVVKGKADGELAWYGPIIVTGDVNFGGGGLIKGVILSGGVNEQDEFGGSTWVRYCSSSVSQLTNPTTPYQILRWVELFN